MTRARKSLIDLAATSYYHLIARCVRRAFLCGDDKYTGQNFDHRRDWLVKRIKLLSSVFAIDIAAYAIMSNHYHLVVKVNRREALAWSDDEVIARWQKLYSGHVVVNRLNKGKQLDRVTLSQRDGIIAQWRARLYDISWYMKSLNEYIARKANKEDNCTGKYWEGRYKSQALLDQQSVLSCMAYVDLNPIRAKAANSIEESDFTSIQERITHFKAAQNEESQATYVTKNKSENLPLQPIQLMTLYEHELAHTIPFALLDYLQLVDWSGRQLNRSKKGHLSKAAPSILSRLNIEEAQWLESIQRFRHLYSNFAGTQQCLKHHAAKNDVKWYKGAG
ncbi:transposase [Pseudoalteromonas sp.]|uniref:transposase n=1 Tax=Pseudoalteromonas sp. TaxID=53249 RepID=UPI00356904FD